MNRVVIAAVSISIAACSQNPLDDAIGAGRKAAESTLKDPASARHIETFAVRGKGEEGKNTIYACGTIDGKNSFGAYTGGVRYVVQQGIGHDGTRVYNVSIHTEESDHRATSETRFSVKKETVFEKVYWNPSCTNEAHPPTFTGTAW